MDGKKDIDKVVQMTRILDFEASRSSPFGKNTLGDNAYRRAERIVAALHLLTMHISGDEPLRREIRNVANDLLPAILELRPGFRTSGSEAISETRSCIAHLVSLVRVLAVSGLISPGNAESLIMALAELAALFDSERVSMSEDISLSREDLIPRPRIQEQMTSQRQQSLKDMIIKDKKTSKTQVLDYRENNASLLRSNSVLSVLSRGGFFGIKDIHSHLPEYSEKMVQRTLAELISMGKVRKIGSKRWSQYALSEMPQSTTDTDSDAMKAA